MNKEFVLLDFDSTLTKRDTTRFLLIELIKLRPWKFFWVAYFFMKMLLSSNNIIIQHNKNKAIGQLLKGLCDEEISSALLRFASIAKKFYRPLLIKKIKEWDKDGLIILIVTASPGFVVENCLLDLPVFVVGTEFTKVSNKYSGQLESSNCYGNEKVKSIQNWVEKRGISANYREAWSDDFSDYPMLKMADRHLFI